MVQGLGGKSKEGCRPVISRRSAAAELFAARFVVARCQAKP